MEGTQKKGRRLQIVSFVIIAFLVGEVILLVIQNRELKYTLEARTDPIKPLQAGERVDSFRVHTLSGDENTITYTDSTKKYLFFVLSTDCPHCLNNLKHWKEITSNNDNVNCDIFGISMSNLEKTNKYAAERDVSFYLATADTTFEGKYKIAGVPSTILINGNGIVEKVWVGVLTSEQKEEIKNLMSAKSTQINQLNQ